VLGGAGKRNARYSRRPLLVRGEYAPAIAADARFVVPTAS